MVSDVTIRELIALLDLKFPPPLIAPDFSRTWPTNVTTRHRGSPKAILFACFRSWATK
ncbi:13137_t:CDS:1, partial [Funneliformis mosseae]